MIADRTVYNMAADICEGLFAIKSVKYSDFPDDIKYDMIKKIIAPMRYITLLMEAHDVLETEVSRILIAKSPNVVSAWDNVRHTLLREEARRHLEDDPEIIEDVEQAVTLINQISLKSKNVG